MVSETVLEKIKSLAGEVSHREGCRLYDVEWASGPARKLRVFIEKVPGGVSIDDCANVSRGLDLLLDVEGLIPEGAYELEVSSPGLERSLRETWHFEQAIGQRVRIKALQDIVYRQGEDKQKKMRTVQGALKSIDEENLIVEVEAANDEAEEWIVPRKWIDKARVVFADIPKAQNKKRTTKKKKR